MASDRDLYSGVMQLANVLTRRLAPVFEKAKITPQQWAVLSAIADNDGPTTLAAVARTLMVSKQNMTGMVTRLVDVGLLERSDDPDDLRSSRVQLSRRGRAMVERLRPAYDEFLASLDSASLARSIGRLIDSLES
jgi:DNA-binding MarR family transcriptional regulator